MSMPGEPVSVSRKEIKSGMLENDVSKNGLALNMSAATYEALAALTR